MERLILDTSVLVATERSAAALDRLIADDDDVAIAAVTAAELFVGVELATGRTRTRRAAFVEELLEAVNVEEYTLAVARAHGLLLAEVRRSGRPRGAHDLIIAATARASNRAIITTDARGFRDLSSVRVRRLG